MNKSYFVIFATVSFLEISFALFNIIIINIINHSTLFLSFYKKNADFYIIATVFLLEIILAIFHIFIFNVVNHTTLFRSFYKKKCKFLYLSLPMNQTQLHPFNYRMFIIFVVACIPMVKGPTDSLGSLCRLFSHKHNVQCKHFLHCKSLTKKQVDLRISMFKNKIKI